MKSVTIEAKTFAEMLGITEGELIFAIKKTGTFKNKTIPQPHEGFVNGMVASHLLCHSGTINRHSLNGALLS